MQYNICEKVCKFYKEGSEQLAISKVPICRLDGCSDFVLQCKIEVVFTPGENTSHAAPNSLQDRAHAFYLFMTIIIQDNKRKQCQHTPCWALLEASGFPLNFLWGHVCHLSKKDFTARQIRNVFNSCLKNNVQAALSFGRNQLNVRRTFFFDEYGPSFK